MKYPRTETSDKAENYKFNYKYKYKFSYKYKYKFNYKYKCFAQLQIQLQVKIQIQLKYKYKFNYKYKYKFSYKYKCFAHLPKRRSCLDLAWPVSKTNPDLQTCKDAKHAIVKYVIFEEKSPSIIYPSHKKYVCPTLKDMRLNKL